MSENRQKGTGIEKLFEICRLAQISTEAFRQNTVFVVGATCGRPRACEARPYYYQKARTQKVHNFPFRWEKPQKTAQKSRSTAGAALLKHPHCAIFSGIGSVSSSHRSSASCRSRINSSRSAKKSRGRISSTTSETAANNL